MGACAASISRSVGAWWLKVCSKVGWEWVVCAQEGQGRASERLRVRDQISGSLRRPSFFCVFSPRFASDFSDRVILNTYFFHLPKSAPGEIPPECEIRRSKTPKLREKIQILILTVISARRF